MSALRLSVVPPASRMGLKGRDAATLLARAGFTVPGPNRIALCALDGGTVRLLRLGGTEFLLEQDEDDAVITRLAAQARSAGLQAWPVLRADCRLLVSGETLFDSLSRLCAFDFTRLAAEPDLVVMTLMAEISVTLALEPGTPLTGAAGPQLRLWADAGFATYLIQTIKSLSTAPSPGVHP